MNETRYNYMGWTIRARRVGLFRLVELTCEQEGFPTLTVRSLFLRHALSVARRIILNSERVAAAIAARLYFNRPL